MALAGFSAGLVTSIFAFLGSGSDAKTAAELVGQIAVVSLGLGGICALIGPQRAARFIEFLFKVGP